MPEKLIRGTANLIRQVGAYRELELEYGKPVATAFVSRNLQKNGFNVPPEGVAWWAEINSAAIAGNVDINEDLVIANSLTAKVTGTDIPDEVRSNGSDRLFQPNTLQFRKGSLMNYGTSLNGSPPVTGATH